ncbi:uncharacterized protein LOC110037992 [Phalaenopsis equestris]|uniref:uncharacterized protein LOC110037992 n=1 Tax=Phalaenopsis equestris TaxID=78828 RepID=UPI0009E29628|nr:uncharacterized protein LOC110037992 [Phalaenopsis equestris]
MATPIDLDTNVQWRRATYVGVVGRTKEALQDPKHLVFPQVFHDTLVGKGCASCIHPSGLKEGEPAIFFFVQDIPEMKTKVRFTLIRKFMLGHPKMELMRNFFESLQFIGSWQLGLLDGRHLLIQLTMEEDYARLFAKQSVMIVGSSMKILKWTPDFDHSKDPPVVPIWFKFLGLPLHQFKLNALFNISSVIGMPLKVDTPTYNKVRPALARIFIERDITLPEMKRI